MDKYKTWRIELPDSCNLVKKEPFGSLTLMRHKYTIFESLNEKLTDEFVTLVEKALNKRFNIKLEVVVINRKKNTFKMAFKYEKELVNFDVVLLRHIKK